LISHLSSCGGRESAEPVGDWSDIDILLVVDNFLTLSHSCLLSASYSFLTDLEFKCGGLLLVRFRELMKVGIPTFTTTETTN
jgi:hypothetical protein